MRIRPSAAVWMGAAFCAELAATAGVLAVLGTGQAGIRAALLVSARLAFLLFWPAYAGHALASLFGPVFQPLALRARALGLAFAAALLVHLGLVAWLCLIGFVPPRSTFVIFGTAALCIYLLALCSTDRAQHLLGSKSWRVLRSLGMNYVAYAFAVDFLRDPRHHGIKHAALYLPFAVLAIAGPGLRLAAFLSAARRVPSTAR